MGDIGIKRLPVELYLKIFSYLSFSDCVHASRVSRFWQTLVICDRTCLDSHYQELFQYPRYIYYTPDRQPNVPGIHRLFYESGIALENDRLGPSFSLHCHVAKSTIEPSLIRFRDYCIDPSSQRMVPGVPIETDISDSPMLDEPVCCQLKCEVTKDTRLRDGLAPRPCDLQINARLSVHCPSIIWQQVQSDTILITEKTTNRELIKQIWEISKTRIPSWMTGSEHYWLHIPVYCSHEYWYEGRIRITVSIQKSFQG